MIRCEAVFSGRVQGVGFRYTAQDYAQSLGLVGWIKNLPDRTVRMVVEGEESSIQDLIQYLEVNFIIKEKCVERSKALGGFTEFDITY